MEFEPTPTIIVCLDNSNASNVALRYACYKAKRTGFAVQILAVMESSYKNLLFVSKVVGKDKRMEIEKHLNKVIDEIYKETGVMPSISIREGDTVTEIIKEIKATPSCTLLVLGKSYNSASDNTVLPKISTQIGNKIKVPITIVPENLSKEYLKKLV
jgi:nucleotide-binding universal stress UspA family protein